MEKDRNTMIDFLTDEQLTKEYEKAMEALNADTDIYDLLEFAH